jgi:hypothetical protein
VNTVETVEATTGQVIGIVSGTAVAAVAGSATGSLTASQGPLVQWLTSTVVGRRLLRGRTFLTPSGTSAIGSNGLVVAGVTTAILTAGATYIASTPAQPVIWHRPVPYGTGTNGVAAVIAGVSSPAKVAVLRSRRD